MVLHFDRSGLHLRLITWYRLFVDIFDVLDSGCVAEYALRTFCVILTKYTLFAHSYTRVHIFYFIKWITAFIDQCRLFPCVLLVIIDWIAVDTVVITFWFTARHRAYRFIVLVHVFILRIDIYMPI